LRKDEIIKEICDQLVQNETIEGYAYDHFTDEDPISLPFAVYRRVATQSFSADDKTYHHGDNVDLELYSSDPEEMADIMAAVEEKLEAAELFYTIAADTAYIDSEQMYESLYEL